MNDQEDFDRVWVPWLNFVHVLRLSKSKRSSHGSIIYVLCIYIYNIDPGKPAAEVSQT